jgi:hypothetical protein
VGLGGIVRVVELTDLDPGQDQPPAEGAGDATHPTALSDGHIAATERGRRVAQLRPGAHRRDHFGLVVTALQAHELTQRHAAGDAVDGETGVALEFGQRARGAVAEDPVNPARVKAERAQPLLQVGDIVAPLHGRTAVEEPIPDAKACLNQGVPGLGATSAIDP